MVIVNGREVVLYNCTYDHVSGSSFIRPSVYGKVGEPAARIEEISMDEEIYSYHYKLKSYRDERYGEFPGTIVVDGTGYTLVYGGDDEISYLKTSAIDESVFIVLQLSLIHISEPTRRTPISYAVFC